jgi:hypothetical protein
MMGDISQNCQAYVEQPQLLFAEDFPPENWWPQPMFEQPGEQPVGPFVFEFSVPFTADLIALAPNQTVEANGIELALENVFITPSMARVVLHGNQRLNISATNKGPFDFATISLEMGSGERQPTGFNVPEGPHAFCLDLEFPMPYVEKPENWQLSIGADSGDPWVFEFESPGFGN